MDVKSPLINGILDEEVYIEQLEGFIDPKKKDMVCKLHKALYGLKKLQEHGMKDCITTLFRLVFKELMTTIVLTSSKDQITRLFWQKYFWMILCLQGMMINVNNFQRK